MKFIIGILVITGLLFFGNTIYLSFFIDCFSERLAYVVSPDEKYFLEHQNLTCKNDKTVVEIYLGEIGGNVKTVIFSALHTTTLPLVLSWAEENTVYIHYPDLLSPTTRDTSYNNNNILIEYDTYQSVIKPKSWN